MSPPVGSLPWLLQHPVHSVSSLFCIVLFHIYRFHGHSWRLRVWLIPLWFFYARPRAWEKFADWSAITEWEREWELRKTQNKKWDRPGSHAACVTVCLWANHCLSLNFSSFFIKWRSRSLPPSQPCKEDLGRDDGYENYSLSRVVHYVSLNSLCVLGQDSVFSGTFSSLMPQMTTKFPCGSSLAPEHESLVLRSLIFSLSKTTEALTGPGL